MPGDPVDLRITLQQLEVFCRVVELESVTRVAEERHVAQPSITGQLRALEQRLGAKLIYWSGRHMHLTDAGAGVLAWARNILGETKALGDELEALRSGPSGSVTIGASPSLGTYLLPTVLFDLQKSMTDLHLVLRVFDPVTTVAQLAEGHVDFAVVTLTSVPQSTRATWRQVGIDEFILVTKPDAFASGDGAAETVARLPFVCAARGQNTRYLVDKQFSAYGVGERTIAMECGTPETIMAAVRAGLGVAFLSRHATMADLQSGALVELPCEIKVQIPILIGFPNRIQMSYAKATVLERLLSILPQANAKQTNGKPWTLPAETSLTIPSELALAESLPH